LTKETSSPPVNHVVSKVKEALSLKTDTNEKPNLLQFGHSLTERVIGLALSTDENTASLHLEILESLFDLAASDLKKDELSCVVLQALTLAFCLI